MSNYQSLYLSENVYLQVGLGEIFADAFSDSDTFRNTNDPLIFYEGNYCSENIVGSMFILNLEICKYF